MYVSIRYVFQTALCWCHSRGGGYKLWLAGKLPGIQSNTYRGAHPIIKTWVYTNSCKIWTWNRLKMLRNRLSFCVWLFGINIQPDWFFLKPFSVLSLNNKKLNNWWVGVLYPTLNDENHYYIIKYYSILFTECSLNVLVFC